MASLLVAFGTLSALALVVVVVVVNCWALGVDAARAGGWGVGKISVYFSPPREVDRI